MHTRRCVLVALGVGLTALAGCTQSDETPTDTPAGAQDAPATTDAPTASESSATGSADTDSPATESDLDLREANVVSVTVEAQGDGQYRFDVTLIHDDEGEDGYANWWQVETTDGDRLGRRELLHAHGTREFTRSETISVPEDVTRVVVRGHDQTHGYGGQAMVVDLASGETRAVRQGEERQVIE